MSLLSNLSSEGLEQNEDRLGGFQLKSTDLYEAEIKLAYVTKSDGGAMAINLIFNIDGKEYRERPIYVTNKDGENFYITKETNKKAQLPGFNLVNNLCRVAVDKELSQLTDEEKTIKVYDSTEKKEIPKSMPCLTELHGAKVILAIEEQTVNKTKKNENTNKYEEIADSREQNEIVHVFHRETGATVNEITAYNKAKADGKTPPAFEFGKLWQEKYAGKKIDKRKIKDGQDGAPKSGRPAASAGAAAASNTATPSLFNRDK